MPDNQIYQDYTVYLKRYNRYNVPHSGYFFCPTSTDRLICYNRIIHIERLKMGELFNIVEKYFTDEEWYFMKLDGKSILQLSYQGKNGKWSCYAQVQEEQQLFYFYSVCPINVPEEKRMAAAEFLTRANYGLRVGNFEMDFSDGEVRYKTSLDVENDRLSPALISNLVYANLWTLDRYLPGLMSVIYGGITPQEAVDSVESPKEEE